MSRPKLSISRTNQEIRERCIEAAKRFTTLLTTDEHVIKQKCETSLYEFVKRFWYVVEGENTFHDNWHIDVICQHLQACVEGRIKKIIINIPPRHMKSLLCCVFFPAWVWCTKPHLKFFGLSGAMKLAIRDNVKCRRLIQSTEYQKYWGNQFDICADSNTKQRFENNRGGQKLIQSIMSSSMGEGGHFLIMDDPNSSQDIDSEVMREGTNDSFDNAIGIRRDNTERSVLIVIQQRIHEMDLTGHILQKEYPDLVHLMLPLEFEPDRKCKTIPLAGMTTPWEDPRTEKDEILWPSRFSRTYIDNDLKKTIQSDYHRAAQFQQRPAPAEGGIFKKEWFMLWEEKYLPRCEFVIQSWDTALSIREDACESGMTVWGIFKDDANQNRIILLNCWSGRLEHPDLRKMIIRCSNNYFTSSFESPERQGPRPDILLIEDAYNGKALIHDLRVANINVTAFDPKNHGLKSEAGQKATSKIARARLASLLCEQKLVYLPLKPNSNTKELCSFAEKLLNSTLLFPRGGNKDLIDSMSQAFIFMRKHELIHLRGEAPESFMPEWKGYEPYDHRTQVEDRLDNPAFNQKSITISTQPQPY